jgi:hypothetical protein
MHQLKESEVLSTIDELNQYLLGNVPTRSLVKTLTELQLLLCEVETKFHDIESTNLKNRIANREIWWSFREV